MSENLSQLMEFLSPILSSNMEIDVFDENMIIVRVWETPDLGGEDNWVEIQFFIEAQDEHGVFNIEAKAYRRPDLEDKGVIIDQKVIGYVSDAHRRVLEFVQRVSGQRGDKPIVPETPLANEPEMRFGQLSDGQHLWIKSKDELKIFDDAQLKGRPTPLAELETAEAVYDAQSNSIKIISSPTRAVIGLVLPMPRVVELFTIIPPYGDSEGKTERDPLHKNPTDNRNFIDPKIIPEPYENTLDYITPTSKGDGYRAAQVTQADHASKGSSPMIPRLTKEKTFRGGVLLTLKEELADDRPEQVTRILMASLKGNGFSPLRIWWEKPDRGHGEVEYDVEEADNPRLAEIEIDWPNFQADLQYRRAVVDSWSFLLGQGRYPYFVQK